LGLNAIKVELEDLAFKFTEPQMYKEISVKLAETKNSRQRYIREFIDPMKEELDKSGLTITEIKGRPKSIFSIAQKMKKQNIPFEEVYDAFAIRVIVESPLHLEKADCWKVYSIITDMYRSHSSRLRDWLSHPKSNGYSALHTTVLGPKSRWVEVQIRSKRMDDIAERGLAAHWRYKAGSNQGNTPQDDAFDNWLNAVKETLANNDLNALDLVSEFRSSLLGEEIYIFTPKGDVKAVSSGATALDFAFTIHSEVGKRCLGAKVNNKLVPLHHQLKNGDIVEILTTQKDRVNRDWLEIVKTARAKSKIREALKAERTQKAKQGKLLMDRLFRKHNLVWDEFSLQKFLKHFRYTVGAEFYHSVAEGQVRLHRQTIFDILDKKSKETKPEIEKSTPTATNKKKKAAEIVIGEDYELPYALAKCCNPVPGDSIFGFVTVGEGIKIHRTNCPNATRLLSQYGYRVIAANWRGDGYQKSFEAQLHVRGIDDVGIVSKITDIISKDMEVDMRSINIEAMEEGTFEGKIKVMITDLLHLEQLMEKIKATHKYIEVNREV
jgi:GTP pyrophosphokinase